MLRSIKIKTAPDQPIFRYNTKINNYLKKASAIILFTIVAVDIIFIALHALKSLGYFTDPNLSVTKNFGYAESFQYLKAGFIAAGFIWLAAKFKKPLLNCWAAVFIYILFDDSLEIHEKAGHFISNNFDSLIPFAGIGSTAGELIAFGLIGLLLFLPLFYYYFISTKESLKIMSQDMFIFFIGLTFFGIAVDVLHDFATTGTVANGMLGIIEDGGEMIIMSIIVWYTWSFIKYGRATDKTVPEKATNKTMNKPPFSRDRKSMPKPIFSERKREAGLKNNSL